MRICLLSKAEHVNWWSSKNKMALPPSCLSSPPLFLTWLAHFSSLTHADDLVAGCSSSSSRRRRRRNEKKRRKDRS
jgi:hypothetical protein